MEQEIGLESLYQIKAPHFVAGIVVRNGRIAEAAPILRWATMERFDWFRGYCQRKKWEILSKLEKALKV